MADVGAALDLALKVTEIVAFLGGGGMAVYGFGRMSGRITSAITTQATSITLLQTDVRELNKLITAVALQTQRLDTHDHRLDVNETHWEELRRGEGYLLPLNLRAKAVKPG